MIYVPIDVNAPISTTNQINVQKGLTNKYPDIIIELHDGKKYFDLTDKCIISAAVTNTDLKTISFYGDIKIVNPHRGQIRLTPGASAFTMSGINTITVLCITATRSVSFQFTAFVQSISDDLYDVLGHPYIVVGMQASDVEYDNTDSGLAADNVQDAIDELKQSIKTIQTTEVTVILYADQWNHGIYEISNENIKSNSDIFVTIPQDITEEQYTAIAYANIIQAGVGVGYVLLSPLREQPIIDIPVNLVIKTEI